ncbi:hypothetical protein [Bacillus infantis]|uniref:hypothetical protein n=1 Tax=Bacillus infantis TaxID=324767 RepID=UPI003CF20F19
MQKKFVCDVCEREIQTLKKRESQNSKIMIEAGVMAGEAVEENEFVCESKKI